MKTNNNYEAPVAEMIEMQMHTAVLSMSLGNVGGGTSTGGMLS